MPLPMPLYAAAGGTGPKYDDSSELQYSDVDHYSQSTRNRRGRDRGCTGTVIFCGPAPVLIQEHRFGSDLGSPQLQ